MSDPTKLGNPPGKSTGLYFDALVEATLDKHDGLFLSGNAQAAMESATVMMQKLKARDVGIISLPWPKKMVDKIITAPSQEVAQKIYPAMDANELGALYELGQAAKGQGITLLGHGDKILDIVARNSMLTREEKDQQKAARAHPDNQAKAAYIRKENALGEKYLVIDDVQRSEHLSAADKSKSTLNGLLGVPSIDLFGPGENTPPGNTYYATDKSADYLAAMPTSVIAELGKSLLGGNYAADAPPTPTPLSANAAKNLGAKQR